MVAEIGSGLPAKYSKFAPLNAAYQRQWDRLVVQIEDIHKRGYRAEFDSFQ